MAVSVTFNDLIPATKIYCYDSVAGTFSSDYSGTAAFDYFGDSAVAGDYVAFANDYKSYDFRYVTVYVGTSFVATSQTFVWEYLGTDGIWRALTDVGNGDAFTLSGEQEVTWDHNSVPYKYGGKPLNGYTGFWVRCRLSAVSGITEGGANSTSTVKLGNNMISVSGGTEGAEADFDDIYSADVANGWGVVTKTSTDVWHIANAGVSISDYFKDSKKIVSLGSIYKGLTTEAGAVLTFGSLSAGIGRDGMVIIETGGRHEGTAHMYGTIKLYQTSWFYSASINVYWKNSITWYNCIFGNLLGGNRRFVINPSSAPTIVNSLIQVDGRLIGFIDFTTSQSCVLDNAQFTTGIHWETQYQTTFIASNMTAPYFDFTLKYQDSLLVHARNLTYTNLYTLSWYPGTKDSTCTVQEEFGFDLTVVDNNGTVIEGATVTIEDSGGTQVFSGTTDEDGQITTQYLVYRAWVDMTYGQDPDSLGEDGATSKTPHTVTISATGYQTKTMVLTMDRKREEVAVLKNRREV